MKSNPLVVLLGLILGLFIVQLLVPVQALPQEPAPPAQDLDDAKYFGITMPPEVPMKGQERAYTSPIWYTPAK
jgi:hypothetical protein